MFTYRYRELPVELTKKGEYRVALAKELCINSEEIFNLEVERFSLDCRKRNFPKWSYNVIFDLNKKIKATKNNAKGLIECTRPETLLDLDLQKSSVSMPTHIDIIGAGPSGLWAALHLLQKGFTVDIYEQGKCVADRFKDIRKFFVDKKFNEYSNVLFGEGGAGAFSDGKLNTRSRNYFSTLVLKDMVNFGVDNSIVTFAKPHIGTDKLAIMLQKIRAKILQLGGNFHFGYALKNIEIKNGRICAIELQNVNGNSLSHFKNCEALVLAIGHSARNVYKMLYAQGVALESKAFAMGVRVEHPQNIINDRQLGANVNVKLTGAAEYFLAAKTKKSGSSAYSFCMCPGGVLVPCASEFGSLATNGMSYSKRNGKFANAAIVTPINASKNLFGGLEFQQKIERAAFDVAGKNYCAPAQSIKAFLKKVTDKILKKSTYPCGIVQSNLWDWLDKNICENLAEGFLDFDKKIHGFIDEGLIIAPETRTSSPLRITRDSKTLESINVKGLFVLGEGAGYSGGIVTSAADGVKLAFNAKKEL